MEGRASTPYAIWRFNNKIRTIPTGKILRVETLAPAVVHWGGAGWTGVNDVQTIDTGLGVFVADLDTAGLAPGSHVIFTFYWPDVGHWEGADHVVAVRP